MLRIILLNLFIKMFIIFGFFFEGWVVFGVKKFRLREDDFDVVLDILFLIFIKINII